MNFPTLRPAAKAKSTILWLLASLAIAAAVAGAARANAQAAPAGDSDGGPGGGGEAAPPPAGSASLTVTFQGLRTPSGAIMASLLASPEAWAGKAPAAAQAEAAVSGTSVSVTFTGLAPGVYAIKSFHDLDGDGKLNTNPFGIPTEPYAFSNNARGAMGPAPWKAAAFTVAAGDNRQTIDID